MCATATELLTQATGGDEAAAARLLPLAYDELRRLASRYLGRGGGAGVTLQPTVLVHEAYLRLVDQKTADLNSQTHFYAIAATAMRQALIDHVRGKQRAKRGGGWQRVTLSGVSAAAGGAEIDLIALDEALVKLAERDSRAAKVVELRFLGGLTEKEVARMLDVSERTIRNDWRMAQAWLRCELADGDGAPGS